MASQYKTITLLSQFKGKMPLVSDVKPHATYINYFKPGESGRERLEAFISLVFKKYYNTELDQFYPNLLAIESHTIVQSSTENTINAVAGVRCAADEALFSEHYLTNKLETELERLFGKIISRDQVVEVGNLAPASVGQMRWLITLITGFLYSSGYKYIVFTAVSGIYNSFERMDIPLKSITEAKQSCLPVEIQDKWGTEYYQLKPMVLAGNIVEEFEILEQNIYSNNKQLIPLFEEACLLGEQTLKNRNQASCFDQKGNAA